MEPTIRIASERDLPAIERVVYDAYKGYIPLIGKPPAPMSDDYGRQIEAGNVWVLLLDDQLVGLVVLVRQGAICCWIMLRSHRKDKVADWGALLSTSLRRRSGSCGYNEIHLYTNELMHQNLALYKRLGYQETARRLDSGFRRVFMKKTL
jgi:hypothetical protein